MYSCWVKIFQKRDNICRWLGSTPLASAYLMIDESSTHMIKLWKALKSILPYPAFLIVPALTVSLLVSCMTTVDTNFVLQPSLYLFCIEELCALYHPLLSIPQRDQGSPPRHRFSVFFFLPHSSLFQWIHCAR